MLLWGRSSGLGCRNGGGSAVQNMERALEAARGLLRCPVKDAGAGGCSALIWGVCSLCVPSEPGPFLPL